MGHTEEQDSRQDTWSSGEKWNHFRPEVTTEKMESHQGTKSKGVCSWSELMSLLSPLYNTVRMPCPLLSQNREIGAWDRAKVNPIGTLKALLSLVRLETWPSRPSTRGHCGWEGFLGILSTTRRQWLRFPLCLIDSSPALPVTWLSHIGTHHWWEPGAGAQDTETSHGPQVPSTSLQYNISKGSHQMLTLSLKHHSAEVPPTAKSWQLGSLYIFFSSLM